MRQPLPLEREAIERRRVEYDIDTRAPICGLALSGGGIRSATFSLGLLRGLSSLNRLQRIDYLSTVSGGGYAGVFFCGLFVPRRGQQPVIEPGCDLDLLGQPRACEALAYLRQSGRYLTPGGGRDFVYAATMLVRNWITLALVMGMAIVFGELVLDTIRWQLFPRLSWAWQIPLVVSPLALLLPVMMVIGLGIGWGFWLTMSDVSTPRFRPPLIGTVLIFAGSIFLAYRLDSRYPEQAWKVAPAVLAVVAAVALISWTIASLVERSASERAAEQAGVRRESHHLKAIGEDRVRHRLALWQSSAALAFLVVAFFALADSATYLFTLNPNVSMPLSALPAAIVPLAQSLLKRLALRPTGAQPVATGLLARFGPLLTWVAALLLVLASLAFWGAIAHLLMWGTLDFDQLDTPLGATEADKEIEPTQFHLYALLGAGVFVILASYSRGFVNLSSLASFYADRLCRAYLGAGNPQRIGLDEAGGTGRAKAVQETDEHDDLGLHEYYTSARGAPVHLINVTINETHGKGPATVQRDRRGLNMVISPDGMLYSEVARGPATLKALGNEARQEGNARPAGHGLELEGPGQSLPLSSWIGISGAAFSTGLGSQTSLAKAVLAFVANVRLGYWWKADRDATQLVPTTYRNLFHEMKASFPGTAGPHWYLTDGGHFENTGVYELIRRQVPLIILSDNGHDPKYGFEDIANLVRKARIDFNAEIRFLDADKLNSCFRDCDDNGKLRQLFAEPASFATCEQPDLAIAMLGRINYGPGVADGTLLVVKPRLSADGPSDLMRYVTDNPDFPQQTTLDQFFDEAQWESYYELGRLIARRLFKDRPNCRRGWQPAQMLPVEWAATGVGIS